VFRFPFGELCPLPGEFGAIGGWSRTIDPVDIPLAMNFRSRFKNTMLLSDTEMDDLLVDGRIQMVKFAQKYSNPLNNHITPLIRRRALCFCLVQRYLFEGMLGKSALGDMRLMSLVEQVEGGRTCAHIVLAETIYGLDLKKWGRERAFLGSPIMLQVWLMEHLNLLEPPVNYERYEANQLKNRKRHMNVDRMRPRAYFDNLI